MGKELHEAAVADGKRRWWQVDLPRQGCLGWRGHQAVIGEEVTSAGAVTTGGDRGDVRRWWRHGRATGTAT